MLINFLASKLVIPQRVHVACSRVSMYPVMKGLDVEVIFSALLSRQNTCEVHFQIHLVRRPPTSFPGALYAEAVGKLPSAAPLRLSSIVHFSLKNPMHLSKGSKAVACEI